jgi:hypothetical protein
MPPRVPNLPRKPFNFIVFDHAEKSGGNAFKSRRGRLFRVGVFGRKLQPTPERTKGQAKSAASPQLEKLARDGQVDDRIHPRVHHTRCHRSLIWTIVFGLAIKVL